MKKHLLILVLLLLVTMSYGQNFNVTDTISLAYGSNGYVTINGQNYKRGDLLSKYYYPTTGDSTLAILYGYSMTTLIKARKNSLYIYADSSRRSARSMTVLRTWMNTNFEYRGN